MPIEQIRDPKFDCINLDELLKNLNNCAENLTCIIILDACRADKENDVWKAKGDRQDGSCKPAFGKALNSNVRMPNESEFALIDSSDPGTVSYDGTSGDNGFFTSALLNNLNGPTWRLDDIMHRVTEEILIKSSKKQRPWINSCLTRPFYFKEGL